MYTYMYIHTCIYAYRYMYTYLFSYVHTYIDIYIRHTSSDIPYLCTLPSPMCSGKYMHMRV